jgi:hypothetical protein
MATPKWQADSAKLFATVSANAKRDRHAKKVIGKMAKVVRKANRAKKFYRTVGNAAKKIQKLIKF